MIEVSRDISSKVPEVTLIFWIIKIAATTLGETGGDSVTMTMHWGYLAGTALFLMLLVVLVVAQTVAKKFYPFLYWATIVASTTFGTTMADFADRSLGIGYTGGSSILLLCLLAVLGLWYQSLGSLSVDTVNTPKVEAFYWAAITFSQTLGDSAGRLDGRFDRPWIRRRGARLRRGPERCRWRLLSHQCLARAAVLGRVHPHPAAGGHGGRLPRQAGQPWRTRAEPSACLGSHHGVHSRVPARTAATRREAQPSGDVV